jgi:hypothetical protein
VRAFLALIIGVLVGGLAVWYFSTGKGSANLRTTGQQIESATKPARDAIQEKLSHFHLDSDQIRDELSKTGQIVRKKAAEAGHAIADATADARTTAAIKTKLIADPQLTGLSISVNTTDGIVTLSGSVSSPGDVGKAVLTALETEGVHEVVSTIQVRARPAPPK